MDGSEAKSLGTVNMTEGKTALSSNGDARNKSKRTSRRKSPRRFRKRTKSSERDNSDSSPPTPTPLSDSEDKAPTFSSTSSRSNSRKRSFGRLFRRSSPLVRTRSLSESRKRHSKLNDGRPTNSAEVPASPTEKSFRTFDPHKKPRGRLRKMTVEEARTEQKQRLLDSVNKLPIYNKSLKGTEETDSGFFRNRSGTSTSLPDITKPYKDDETDLVTPDDTQKTLLSTNTTVCDNSQSNDNTNQAVGQNAASPSCQTATGERRHSSESSPSKAQKQTSKRDRHESDKNSAKEKCFSESGTSSNKFHSSGKDGKHSAGEDVAERRRKSLRTFLKLSNRSISLENPMDAEDSNSQVPVVGHRNLPPTPNSPPPSYSESQRSRLNSPVSPTEKYRSPRTFGRSHSTTTAPKASPEECNVIDPFCRSDRMRRSRSESTKRNRTNRTNPDIKENSPSRGSDKSWKYKRTFSPPRKQNEHDVGVDNVRPAATTNKPDTECNERATIGVGGLDFLSNSSPIEKPDASEKAIVSSLNTTPQDDKFVECAATESQCERGSDYVDVDLSSKSKGDAIECKVVIETPEGEATNVGDGLLETPNTGDNICRVPRRNLLSPYTCVNPSDDETFYDANDSVSADVCNESDLRDTLSPGFDGASQHRGSLVTDDIPFIEEAPDDTGRSSDNSAEQRDEQKKPGKLSFRALVLVKRLSRRSKSVRRKKKTPSPRSSLPDLRIEDCDNQTNQEKDGEQFSFVIENETGKGDNFEPMGFESSKIIDEKGILKKELQFEPVASDDPLPGEDEPSFVLPDLNRRRESRYYRLNEKRRKVVGYCKKFAAFLFSHIGLISLVVAYSIMGGFLFRAIEGPGEDQYRNDIKKLREDTVYNIWDYALLVQISKLEKNNFTESVDILLKSFQKQIHIATKERNWDGDDATLDAPKQWSYASSLLFAITVMTTIGYGHVAPITNLGRIVTIVYAVLGIPLTLLCLTNLGDVMANGFRWLYAKVCCGLCCIPFRSRGRRLPDPEKGENHVTTDEEEEIDKPNEVIHVPTSLCMLLIVGYIFAGAFLFSRWEKWDYLTGSYFCFITLSTIGFGDIVPGMEIQSWSQQEKLVLCTLYLVTGLSVLAMCFTLVQEDVKQKCRWLGEKIGLI